MISFQSLLKLATLRWWSRRRWKGKDSAVKRKCCPRKWINVIVSWRAPVQDWIRLSAGPRKPLPARARFCYWARAGRAKNCSPERFITGAKEKIDLLLPLIVSGFPKSYWIANCLVTNKALLPAPASSSEER